MLWLRNLTQNTDVRIEMPPGLSDMTTKNFCDKMEELPAELAEAEYLIWRAGSLLRFQTSILSA